MAEELLTTGLLPMSFKDAELWSLDKDSEGWFVAKHHKDGSSTMIARVEGFDNDGQPVYRLIWRGPEQLDKDTKKSLAAQLTKLLLEEE